MRRLLWILLTGPLLAGCNDSFDPGTALTVRVLSGGGTDTIDILDTIVVEARLHGLRASGVELQFQPLSISGDSTYGPGVYLPQVICCYPLRETTDAHGRASVLAVHGPRAGDAYVIITATGSTGADTVRFTTNPGVAVATEVEPRDQPVIVGSTYLIAARLVDRRGNTISTNATFSSSSNIVSVDPVGFVHGHVIGRAKIDVHIGTWIDSAFTSVVPAATLAFRDYSGYVGDSSGYAMMSLDGGDFHWLFKTHVLESSYAPSNAGGPQWIPGTGVVIHNRAVSGAPRLFVGDSTGNATRLIATPGPITGEVDPNVSADGLWVYFIGHSATGDAIWRVAASGGVPERVTPESSFAEMNTPSLSPDGTQLAYIKWNRAYVLNLSTGDTTRLTGNQAAGTLWSPAGDWIAYTESYTSGGFSGALHLIRPDGSGDHILTPAAYFWGGTWSPDGKYLVAIVAGLGGSPELIDVATGLRLPLVIGGRTWYAPAWRR